MNWSNWVKSEFNDLHPEKYARDALHTLLLFEKGEIDYPEVTLKLAGDEAWSNAFPPLKKAIHDLVLLIKRSEKRTECRTALQCRSKSESKYSRKPRNAGSCER